MIKSSIDSEIDFDAPGKQLGYLRLPHSVHRSAYGWIPIPVACISNGTGRTALLMAGNHGDEYEGQVVLSNLIRDINVDDVTGRIIILPMANFPAAAAGLRTSPIDDGNLNRSFPGAVDGTVTEVIAHYIEEVLLELSDIFVDLHSGGSSLTYLPSMFLPRGSTVEDDASNREIFAAFGLPYALLYEDDPTGRFAGGAASRKYQIYLTTELGGAGMVTPDIRRQTESGLKRVLGHFGLYTGATESTETQAPRYMQTGNEDYVYASEAGVFEPLVELGQTVVAGEPAARIYHPETPGKAPTDVPFQTSGFVLCKRVPARVVRGDCLFHLATAIE